MAEEISKEELEAPQKITEGAMLELINLWLMDYKPDDTVEPTSDRPVTAKAVSRMLQTLVRTPYVLNAVIETGQHGETYSHVDIPDEFVYSISDGGKTRQAIDVIFWSTAEESYDFGAPLFQGQVFTLFLHDYNSSATFKGANSEARLVWLLSAGSPVIASRNKFRVLERTASFMIPNNSNQRQITIGSVKETDVADGGEVSQKDQPEEIIEKIHTGTTVSKIIVIKHGA